jgi:hypothetical protein
MHDTDAGRLGRRHLAPLVLVNLGVGMHAMIWYMASTVMPSVVQDLGSADSISWATTVYLVTTILGAVAMAGAKARFGAWWAMVGASVIVALGSLAAALAPSILLAAIGGLGLAWLFASAQVWARAAGVVAAGHLLLLGSSIDLLMARDSRFAAEAWLAARVDHDELIGMAGPRSYLPRPGRLPVTDVPFDWAEVSAAPPDFLVVNAEFAARDRHTDFFGPLLSGAHPLYREAARFKSSPGPALIAYRPEFSDGVEDPESNFDKINPEIRIYVRRDVTVE